MPREKNYTDWYNEVYPQLSGFGMWLKGGEINTLPKEEIFARPYRVLFARLSTYQDVANSFTHLSLYEIASQIDGVFPDLAYLPPEKDAKIFDRDRIPWLLGTQSKLAAGEFNLVGFSNSFVQELVNIPKFLSTSKIPLHYGERIQREDIPIIILGGANAPYTTAFWGENSPLDGIFIGQGNSEVFYLIERAAQLKKTGKKKAEILAALQEIPGFYPTHGASKRPAEAKTLPAPVEILEKGIVSYDTEAIGEGWLPISEGCRAMCSFCAENWMRKPYRQMDESLLVEKALRMKAERGLEKINLFSFNFNMHTRIYRLLWDLLPLFQTVGLKSQRFDLLGPDERMIECQFASGKVSFSAALEGISPRLRRFLNKKLDEKDLRSSLMQILKIHARELKIFVLSTGMEEAEDFKEFEKLLGYIKEIRRQFKAHTRVIFSITPLVKFPWTPLEFGKAYPPKVHQEVMTRINDLAHQHLFEGREAMDAKEYLLSQLLVRATDPRVFEAIAQAAAENQFVYYRGVSGEFVHSFLESLRQKGLTVDGLLEGFSYESSLKKPWAVLETGVKREFLWRVYEKNSRFEELGGNFNELHVEKPLFPAPDYKDRIPRSGASGYEKIFLYDVGPKARGLVRKYPGIALARALCKADSALTPYFRSYVSSRWARAEEEPVWVTGEDLVTLRWDGKTKDLLEKKLIDPKFIEAVNYHLGDWGKLRTEKPSDQVSFKLNMESSFSFDPMEYFKRKGVKYTLFKDQEGAYHLEFTKESLKKRIILGCSYAVFRNYYLGQETVKVAVEILPGEKFDVDEFLKETFQYPEKNDWVRTTVHSSITRDAKVQ